MRGLCSRSQFTTWLHCMNRVVHRSGRIVSQGLKQSIGPNMSHVMRTLWNRRGEAHVRGRSN